MSSPTVREILSLYKNLLKYNTQLKLTDRDYFTSRIKSEFRANKDLTNLEDIAFSYNTSKALEAGYRHLIDQTRVPKLQESDLEEQFVRGSGPGGSNVQKNSNCVVLKHLPTGTIVKCHQSRLLDDNRKIARQLLITKLDNMLNGEMSVEKQLKRLNETKRTKLDSKKRKLRLLKEKWKEMRDDNTE